MSVLNVVAQDRSNVDTLVGHICDLPWSWRAYCPWGDTPRPRVLAMEHSRTLRLLERTRFVCRSANRPCAPQSPQTKPPKHLQRRTWGVLVMRAHERRNCWCTIDHSKGISVEFDHASNSP